MASDEVVVFCLVLSMRGMSFSALRIADARSVWRTVLCRPSQVNVMSACVLMMDSKVHIYQEIRALKASKIPSLLLSRLCLAILTLCKKDEDARFYTSGSICYTICYFIRSFQGHL